MKLSSVFPAIRKRRPPQETRASDLENHNREKERGKRSFDLLDGDPKLFTNGDQSLSDSEVDPRKSFKNSPDLELKRAAFRSNGGPLKRSLEENSDVDIKPYRGESCSPSFRSRYSGVSRYIADNHQYYSGRGKGLNAREHSFRAESLPVLNQRQLSSLSDSPSPSQTVEFFESPMVNQEDIVTLTHHVRNFSAALNTLRNTFTESEGAGEHADETRAKAHERLGEVLAILKGVLKLYPPLNSVEILSAAGTVIHKIKNHDYLENEDLEDFYQATDQLAWAFSSSVSDFLMGDQDGGSTPVDFPISHARSFENFGQENGDFHGYDLAYEEHDEYHSDHAGSEASLDKGFEDSKGFSNSLEEQDVEGSSKGLDQSAQKARELDKVLLSMENGIDLSLQRTKAWSKYAKDILNYMEKRAHLEVDYSKALAKLAQTTKASISEEYYLPLQSTLITTLEYDLEYANNCQNIFQTLVTSKIIEPLQSRRTDHDRKRSKLKDVWNKECKKLQDCRLNLKKAKSLYFQKQQELEKFSKQLEAREGKEESSTPGFSIGKKKKEEDVAKKAEESEDYYRQCVQEANRREQELEKIRAKVLLDLRQLIYQCDMTMKAVTVAYFQMMQSLAAPLPYHFQTLADGGRDYEVGARFAEYTKLQRPTSQPMRTQRHSFERYRSGERDERPPNRSSSGFADLPLSGAGISPEPYAGVVKGASFGKERRPSVGSIGSDTSNHRPSSPSGGSKPPKNAWGQQRGSASDDTDSLTSRSLPGSPVGSPTTARRNRDLSILSPEPPSDEDILDKDGPLKTPGPFRNYKLSAAANTHAFRKLRSPSKCKECDSYVYFNGAECEQCSITCHKKCLETLAIKCGHKPLPRKMTTFGVDFQKHLQATKRNDIPILIEKCIDEIDSRGLEFRGLYRVSGVKSKVERLCQQFETGADLVDLSTTPPQVVSSVLKLYLRQLPEPLLTFDLYQDFIQIAKDSMTCKFDLGEDEGTEENDTKCEEVLSRLHKVVKKLPHANLCTVEKLLRHLKRVARNSDRNSMTVSSLAIVFGPTLLRPRGRPDSLPALMDMPHQTRVVELLINHSKIVDEDSFDEDEGLKESAAESYNKKSIEEEKGEASKMQRAASTTDELSFGTSIAGQFTEEMLAAWGQGESASKVDSLMLPEKTASSGKDRETPASKAGIVTVQKRHSSAELMVKSPAQGIGHPVEAKIKLGTSTVEDEPTTKSPTSPAASSSSKQPAPPQSEKKASVGTAPESSPPKEPAKAVADEKGGSTMRKGLVEPASSPTLKDLAMEESRREVESSHKEDAESCDSGKEKHKDQVNLRRNNAKREAHLPEKLMQFRNTTEHSTPTISSAADSMDNEEDDKVAVAEASVPIEPPVRVATDVTLKSPPVNPPVNPPVEVTKAEVAEVVPTSEAAAMKKMEAEMARVEAAVKSKAKEAPRQVLVSKEDSEDLLTFISKLRMEISLSDDDVQVNAVSRENSVITLEDIPLSARSLDDSTKRHSSTSTSSTSSEKPTFSPRGSFECLDETMSPANAQSKTLPESQLRGLENAGEQPLGKDVPRIPPKPAKSQPSPPRREKTPRTFVLDEEGLSRRSSRDAMKLGNTKKLVERFSYDTVREEKESGNRQKESSDSDEKIVVSVKDMKKQFEPTLTGKEAGIGAEHGQGSALTTAKSPFEEERPVERSSPRMTQQRLSRDRIQAPDGNGRDRKPAFV